MPTQHVATPFEVFTLVATGPGDFVTSCSTPFDIFFGPTLPDPSAFGHSIAPGNFAGYTLPSGRNAYVRPAEIGTGAARAVTTSSDM